MNALEAAKIAETALDDKLGRYSSIEFERIV